MKNSIKEILWITAVISFATITFHFMFGVASLKGGDIDINIKDTYFVMNAVDFFIPYLLFIFIIVYFFRIVSQKFKNVVADIVFLIANSIQLFLFSSITYIIISELKFDSINIAIASLTLLLFTLEIVVSLKLVK